MASERVTGRPPLAIFMKPIPARGCRYPFPFPDISTKHLLCSGGKEVEEKMGRNNLSCEGKSNNLPCDEMLAQTHVTLLPQCPLSTRGAFCLASSHLGARAYYIESDRNRSEYSQILSTGKSLLREKKKKEKQRKKDFIKFDTY